MSIEPTDRRPASFRPRLKGCVLRDPRLARAAESCCRDAYASLSKTVLFALLAAHEEPELAARMESLAYEELEELLLLGELVLAMGGDPSLMAAGRRFCSDPRKGGGIRTAELLSDRLRDTRLAADRYRRLLSHTSDRVARSVLTRLLAGRERRCEELEGKC